MLIPQAIPSQKCLTDMALDFQFGKLWVFEDQSTLHVQKWSPSAWTYILTGFHIVCVMKEMVHEVRVDKSFRS
jgi:hypothetical protein